MKVHSSPAHRDLAGEHLEQEGVVGRSQGIGVLEGELELRGVVLAVHRLERDTGAVGGCQISSINPWGSTDGPVP